MTKARDLANASTALSAVDATELGYLDGVTSPVQTQLNTKAATANVVNNTLADAKGDLIVGTGADTFARLAVSPTNGDTIVADSSTATGLRWQVPVNVNPVLNSAMQVWQRGTSIAVAASSNPYTCDRWKMSLGSGASYTVSRQATGDSTNLPFIQYAARVQRDSGQTGTNANYFIQGIETINSVPFAGKTITASFYARRGANFSATSNLLSFIVAEGTGTDQDPAGAYTSQNNIFNLNATLTTTWQRFTITGNVASTSTELKAFFSYVPTGTAGAADYYEVTGVQIEVGSVATPFKTYAGTIQGELDACERYLPTITGAGNYYVGGQRSSTNAIFPIAFRVQPRVAPTGITISALSDFFMFNSSLGGYTPTSIAYNTAGLNTGALDVGVSGGTGAATGDAVFFRANANSKILFTGCEL